jgi:carbon storage regulator
MLVLTRKTGEEFVIDGNIRVKIIEIRGRKGRFGIQAPQNTPVHRSEIENSRRANSHVVETVACA